MQHFRVKVFARPATAAAGAPVEKAIPVFHRWIQQNALPELLIDVADYQHVPAGPGVLLMGHEGYYALDQTKNRLGLLYTRRTAQDGSDAERLATALAAADRACALLEKEPEFAGVLSFDRSQVEISVNDRLLAPNTDATAESLNGALRAALDARYGAGNYAFQRVGEPRELFTVAVSAQSPAAGR